MSSPLAALPPSLNLPPHLSAHKYFLVCTLTVAAWDTLVLTPRSWRLSKTPGWPVFKVLFSFLRIFMPVESSSPPCVAGSTDVRAPSLSPSRAHPATAVPLLEGQGCIAGPKHNWVGIYWLAPTLLYTVSVRPALSSSFPAQPISQFALALVRSVKSLQAKPLSLWKLMLRDGLNLYGVSPSQSPPCPALITSHHITRPSSSST
ncbi:hypothetical protein C0993_004170 [Termitomyces sp. T159_Od127]|nr:hypothetical protein C0993_004170 [Termitomyces sp. T159_Od127]